MKKLTKCFIVIFFSTTATVCSGQTQDLNYKNEFYKSKEKFKLDDEVYKYFKKSRRQKITATTLGMISLGSISYSTYELIQYESTGQSVDIAILPVLLGTSFLGAITGITGLLYNSSAKKNRNRTISLYEERYGVGLILNKKSSSEYLIRANLNSNGIGIVISL